MNTISKCGFPGTSRMFALGISLMLGALPSLAQLTSSGTFSGQVTDEHSAGVADATVLLLMSPPTQRGTEQPTRSGDLCF